MSFEQMGEEIRPYKLLHQHISLNSINFVNKSLFGVVEMTFISMVPNLKRIRFNAKQMTIHSINLNYKMDVGFEYEDPFMNCCKHQGIRDLVYYSRIIEELAFTIDPDSNGGEVTVQIPNEAWTAVTKGKRFRLAMTFTLQNPKGGLHFTVPSGLGVFNAHLFTHGPENSSRLCFPCIDSFNELCTWHLEYTVDDSLTVISSGDLIKSIFIPESNEKTLEFEVRVPISAPNIGFAIGPFQLYVNPLFPQVKNYYLADHQSLLKSSTRFLFETFGFYQNILLNKYPFTSYNQVFVDEIVENFRAYASMSIISMNLMYSDRIIDQSFSSRKILALALAEQYFGCFVSIEKISDLWAIKGISQYLAAQYYKQSFGENFYNMYIKSLMDEVVKYEREFGTVVLDVSKVMPPMSHSCTNGLPGRHIDYLHFSIRYLDTMSPRYLEILYKKGLLLVRMLELKIGKEELIKVFKYIIAMAINCSNEKLKTGAWRNMLISTISLIRVIYMMTGQDMNPFMDRWVYNGGHATFKISSVFVHNKRKLKIRIEQLYLRESGSRMYNGPLLITLQEIHKQSQHLLQINNIVEKFHIELDLKHRKHPMKDECPVLWICVDPEMSIIRKVVLNQLDYQWQYQLRYERNVIAEIEAIHALEKYPTKSTCDVLIYRIKNEETYYKVRCRAIKCLVKCLNTHLVPTLHHGTILAMLMDLYGNIGARGILTPNNFTNFSRYFLLRTFITEMAEIRNADGICPAEVIRCISNMMKFNNNSMNMYEDNYYQADLLTAITNSVCSLEKPNNPNVPRQDIHIVCQQIYGKLNWDHLMPSFQYTITVAGLKCLRKLEKLQHITLERNFFMRHTDKWRNINVRLAATECLVDRVQTSGLQEDMEYILQLVENESDSRVVIHLIRTLINQPPFKSGEIHPLKTFELVERLWEYICKRFPNQRKLRCELVDLYFVLFGSFQTSIYNTRVAFVPVPGIPVTGTANPAPDNPGPSGLQTCKHTHKSNKLPTCILTDSSEDDDTDYEVIKYNKRKQLCDKNFSLTNSTSSEGYDSDINIRIRDKNDKHSEDEHQEKKKHIVGKKGKGIKRTRKEY